MPRLKPAPMDKRILKPGWAGEPEPAELAVLIEKLGRNGRLASKWGFGGPIDKQADWAVLQVAMWGDPDSQAFNAALVSQHRSVPDGLQLPLF